MNSVITIDTLIDKLLPQEDESDEPNTISNYNNDNETQVVGLTKYKVKELKELLTNYFEPKVLNKKLKSELMQDVIALKIPFNPKF